MKRDFSLLNFYSLCCNVIGIIACGLSLFLFSSIIGGQETTIMEVLLPFGVGLSLLIIGSFVKLFIGIGEDVEQIKINFINKNKD